MESTGHDAYPVHKTLAEHQPEPIIDVASASVTYKGWAPLGTATSAAKWKIIKYNKVGNVTTPQYADGDMNYDNVWDDRASISYSR